MINSKKRNKQCINVSMRDAKFEHHEPFTKKIYKNIMYTDEIKDETVNMTKEENNIYMDEVKDETDICIHMDET